jgi:hypothetical protein
MGHGLKVPQTTLSQKLHIPWECDASGAHPSRECNTCKRKNGIGGQDSLRGLEFITECTMQGKYFSMSQRSDGPGKLQFSWL